MSVVEVALIGTSTATIVVLEDGGSWLEKNDVGLAIKTTPSKETKPAICSLRVKGSWMRKEQAQHARIGARKVMTVASATGRYMRESVQAVSLNCQKKSTHRSSVQYIP